MPMIPSQFQIVTNPIAETGAVVILPQARFTVLTSRLIRMEYDPDGDYEDHPSQIFWFRKQPVPAYETRLIADGCEIITEHLHLVYVGGAFSKTSLLVASKSQQFTWHFGDIDKANLGGTARTLDDVCGQTLLEPGLISRDGWTVVDDSRSLVFGQNSWLEERNSHPEARDIYFFGYGQDYLACLRDYCKVSGSGARLAALGIGELVESLLGLHAGRAFRTDARFPRSPGASVCLYYRHGLASGGLDGLYMEP